MIGLGSKPLIIGERRANPLGTLTAGQLAQANTWAALQTFSSGVNFGQTTLSYYEVGTWTPVVTCATPGDLSVVNSSVVAKYTRVGNLVTVFLDFRFTPTFTTATGALQISGLPFATTLATNTGIASSGAIGYFFGAGLAKTYSIPVPTVIDGTTKLTFSLTVQGENAGNFLITTLGTGNLGALSLTLSYLVY